MRLRRITQHIKEQNWTAIGIDFVIVVLGVFLGIQLGNWNQSRMNQDAAQASLERLHVELQTIERSAQNNIDMGQLIAGHISDAITAIQSNPAAIEDGSDFAIDVYFAGYQLLSPIGPKRSSEAIKSDDFTHLRDAQMRQEIVRFNKLVALQGSSLDKTTPILPALRRHMPVDVIEQVREGCSRASIGRVDEGGANQFELPETCPPPLTQEQIERTAASFRKGQVLPDLRETLSIIRRQIDTYRLLKAEAKTLAKKIEESRR
ncbi:MAG: hypothetical protein AAFP79_02600 [Pseudomonadota bacterium]